jgi:hypothetical protein
VGSKILKENDFFSPITRGINVREAKSGTVNIEGQISREDVARAGGISDAKNVLVPGRNETTRSPSSVNRLEGSEARGEETGRFSELDWAQLGFLEGDKTGPGGRDVGADTITFVVITKTTNVPRHD